MIFTSLALLSGIALFSSAAPAPAAPATHYVDVSNDTAGLVFNPPYINAVPGDTVSFKFHPKNHSVTQSSFDAPCTPLYGGSDTGFVPVTLGTSDNDLPSREFIVADWDPIWIHCRQAANTAASHCGQGMVFAVNPGSEGSNSSFAAFQAEALAIGEALKESNGTSLSSTTSNNTASNATSWSSSAVTHYVNVSNDTAGLLFDPPYISAAVGDTISFTFHPKNHSVTQTSFYEPCTPLYGGSNTGFVPVTPGTPEYDLPSREFIVEDSEPIWISCQQDANKPTSHCGQGMIFAVNPGSEGSWNSFDNFREKALAVGQALKASNGTNY